MSCSLWNWHPECDGDYCPGDCDYCDKEFDTEYNCLTEEFESIYEED